MLEKFLRRPWVAREDPLRSQLGHLEREVMEVVWRSENLSVREVQARLDRSVAYTTVMTTLDRLFKKGLVRRSQAGRAFVYTALFTREQLAANVTARLLNHVLTNGRNTAAPFLSNLVDVVAERDEDLLEELERLVRNKRDRMRRGRG